MAGCLQELAAQWQGVTAALLAGNKPALAQAALQYAYYWYNFMPLARGTALVGYLTLLALFVAADAPIMQPAPKVSSSPPSLQCAVLTVVRAGLCAQRVDDAVQSPEFGSQLRCWLQLPMLLVIAFQNTPWP